MELEIIKKELQTQISGIDNQIAPLLNQIDHLEEKKLKLTNELKSLSVQREFNGVKLYTLDEVRMRLKSVDETKKIFVVMPDGAMEVINKLDSYRGSYDEPVLLLVDKHTYFKCETVKTVNEDLSSPSGTGYKGGYYVYYGFEPLWVEYDKSFSQGIRICDIIEQSELVILKTIRTK